MIMHIPYVCSGLRMTDMFQHHYGHCGSGDRKAADIQHTVSTVDLKGVFQLHMWWCTPPPVAVTATCLVLYTVALTCLTKCGYSICTHT